MTDELNEYYRTLELEAGASIDEAKKARNVLLRAWYPDQFFNDPEMQDHAKKKTLGYPPAQP
jgi:curved DNA-binding protein CbpA